jgi:hypothetical protein
MKVPKWLIGLIIGMLVVQVLQFISIACLIVVKEDNDKKFKVLADALYVGITKEEFEKQNHIKENKKSALENVKQYYNYMVK